LYPHAIIIEEASLELVPKKFWNHESCKLFESRFGVPPENQILDDNFHHEIVEKLPLTEKRGRPDIVHFALLEIMSTPAYMENKIRPIIHTVNDETILVEDGVRIPRTELRFVGVMSKILRHQSGEPEKKLFRLVPSQDIQGLLKTLSPEKVLGLTTQGNLRDLREVMGVQITGRHRTIAWIVGGFPRGHFSEKVKGLANDLISISDRPLAAHVVTARLSYEIERSEFLGR
jgi:rRNA small subunit pseudouridine methyltransferase Nep1